ADRYLQPYKTIANLRYNEHVESFENSSEVAYTNIGIEENNRVIRGRLLLKSNSNSDEVRYHLLSLVFKLLNPKSVVGQIEPSFVNKANGGGFVLSTAAVKYLNFTYSSSIKFGDNKARFTDELKECL